MTILADTETFDFDPTTLDLLLGHAPAKLSPVARIYQKFDFLPERRRALEAWADFVTAQPQRAEVVPMPLKARRRR